MCIDMVLLKVTENFVKLSLDSRKARDREIVAPLVKHLVAVVPGHYDQRKEIDSVGFLYLLSRRFTYTNLVVAQLYPAVLGALHGHSKSPRALRLLCF